LQLADRKIGVPTVVRLLSPELARSVADSEDVSVLSPVAETASHVCRAAERLRTERLRKLDKAPVRDETTGLDYLPDTGEHRAHGRFAGPEFDAAATRPATGTTDQHLRPGRTPSSPTVDAMPTREESP
jgi:hypothetical protein